MSLNPDFVKQGAWSNCTLQYQKSGEISANPSTQSCWYGVLDGTRQYRAGRTEEQNRGICKAAQGSYPKPEEYFTGCLAVMEGLRKGGPH